MEHAAQYLLDYLAEEFQRHPEVRINFLRSSEDDGVLVRTESREYFFPTVMVVEKRFDEIQRLITKIKDVL